MITAVPECQILRPALLDILPALEELTREVASRKGELRFTVTETETGLDVAVSGGKPLELPLRERLATWSSEANLARLVWNDDVVSMSRQPVIRFGSAPVPIPPGAFLQATREGEAALLVAAIHALGSAECVADLFAGCGTFALSIASQCEVHAVEGEADLLTALDLGWRHGIRLHKVTTEKRDLFRRPLLKDELRRFDAAIIDPPRAGAEAQMIALTEARVPHIASVSCNPVTFARDSAILIRAGYKLARVDVVDQFRWSPHVELIGAFLLA